MNTISEDEIPATEEQVIRFLRNHTGFFQEHPHLLSELNLPHESGSAISLVERQVAILRERNMTMRRRMNELMQTAKDNDVLFQKTRALTLELLHVSGWHELNEVIATFVLTDFHADFVCCHLEKTQVSLDHLTGGTGTLPSEQHLHGNYPICTALRAEELSALFPGDQPEGDGSVVLAPLDLEDQAGCLAIGSRDSKMFTPDMDSLFVTYIAEVLSRVVQRLGSP